MQQECKFNDLPIKREVIVGLLRYTQNCFPVSDFPPIGDDEVWQALWYHIKHDPEMGRFLSGDLPIESVLRGAMSVDFDTRRLHVKLEGLDGRAFEEDFPEDVHRLFRIALETSGFIRFS
jgi:hypothetical protein